MEVGWAEGCAGRAHHDGGGSHSVYKGPGGRELLSTGWEAGSPIRPERGRARGVALLAVRCANDELGLSLPESNNHVSVHTHDLVGTD